MRRVILLYGEEYGDGEFDVSESIITNEDNVDYFVTRRIERQGIEPMSAFYIEEFDFKTLVDMAHKQIEKDRKSYEKSQRKMAYEKLKKEFES